MRKHIYTIYQRKTRTYSSKQRLLQVLSPGRESAMKKVYGRLRCIYAHDARCALARKNCAEHKYSYECKEGQPATLTNIGKIIHCKSENVVTMVVLGVIVETEHRQLREQDTPDWLERFTEGLEEGGSGSSGSAGETIPKTPLPHPSNKSGGEQFIHSFSEGRQRTHKNHESSMQKES